MWSDFQRWNVLTAFTVVSLPPISTDTLVRVDFINASTAVSAGTAFTVIDVWERRETPRLKTGRCWIWWKQRTLGYRYVLLSWQYVPVNPSWHSQLKCPPAWLRQRPWGPQTLEEMSRMPPGVLLDATATVQLSITAGRGWSHQESFWSKSLIYTRSKSNPVTGSHLDQLENKYFLFFLWK